MINKSIDSSNPLTNYFVTRIKIRSWEITFSIQLHRYLINYVNELYIPILKSKL